MARLVFVAMDPARVRPGWQRIAARLLKWPALGGAFCAPIVVVPFCGQLVALVAAAFGQHSAAWALVASIVLAVALLGLAAVGLRRWWRLGIVPIESIAFSAGLAVILAIEIAQVVHPQAGP